MLLPLKGSPFGALDELTSTQMNILNDQIANALDAINGGSYTLLAPVVIDGSSFWTFACNLALHGVTTCSTTIQFTSGSVLQVDVGAFIEVDGSATWMTGSTLTGNAGAVGVWSGLWTFNDDVTCNDPLVCNDNFQHLGGIALFAATVQAGGTWNYVAGCVLNIQTPILLGTGGYIQHNPVTGADSAAVTYDIALDGDVIIYDSLTANRDVIIANATEGAVMEIALSPVGSFGGFFLTLKRADTTVIRFLKPSGSGAGEASATKLIYKGGTWKHYAPTLNTV